MKRMTSTERKIAILANAAQGLRDAHSEQPLREIVCGVASLLSPIESELIASRLIFEANDVRDLREGLLGIWVAEAAPVATAHALLLLHDVCGLLGLDEKQSQQALSLADWCDAQLLLDESIEVGPTALQSQMHLPSPLANPMLVPSLN